MPKCEWCGLEHETKCALVKAIEYFPSGKVKRVEFMTPNDQGPMWFGGNLVPQPALVPTVFPPSTWLVTTGGQS